MTALVTPIERLVVWVEATAPRRWVSVEDRWRRTGWFGPLRAVGSVTAALPPALPRLICTDAWYEWLESMELPAWLRAALDGAAWDLACRQRGLPFWRVAAPTFRRPARVVPYASVLGLTREQLSGVAEQVPRRWKALKLSISAPLPESEVDSVGVALGAVARRRPIAFDAHLRKTPAMRSLLEEIAPAVCWIEDPLPFALLDDLTTAVRSKTVVGEGVADPRHVRTLCAIPGIWGVQLEPSRLGITPVLRASRWLEPTTRLLLHGHLPATATALAAAIGRERLTLVEHNLRWATQRWADRRRFVDLHDAGLVAAPTARLEHEGEVSATS